MNLFIYQYIAISSSFLHGGISSDHDWDVGTEHADGQYTEVIWEDYCEKTTTWLHQLNRILSIEHICIYLLHQLVIFVASIHQKKTSTCWFKGNSPNFCLFIHLFETSWCERKGAMGVRLHWDSWKDWGGSLERISHSPVFPAPMQIWVVATQIFFIFNPKIGEMIQFDEHIFQMGF